MEMEKMIDAALVSMETLDNKKHALLKNYKRIMNDENQTVKTVRETTESYNATRFSVDYSHLRNEIKKYKNSIVCNDDPCDQVKTCFLYGGADELLHFRLPQELDPFVRCVWVDCNIVTLYGIMENPNDYNSFVSDIHDSEGHVEIEQDLQDFWGSFTKDIDILDGKHKNFLKKFPVDSIDDFINQEWQGIDWELIDRSDGSVFSSSGAPVKVLVAYFGITVYQVRKIFN